CCFFHCSPALPDLPSFPTRRSSDLFRTSAGHEPAREADTVPFGTYRRRVFERIGLFNPNMVRHQDYEFHFRLRANGGRILLLPGLKATYHVRPSLRSLWRQYWQYGIWKGRLVRRYPESLRPRHLIPSLFALVLGLVTFAALFSFAARVAWVALVSLYVLFLAAAVVVMRRRLPADR